jgi:hypothetical protein
VDGKYFFCTQNSGKDTVKSPEGMFPSYAIPNDLKYVDDAIRNYYGMAGAKTDAEMAEEHQEASQDLPKPASGRRSRKKAEETPAQEVPPQEKVQEASQEPVQEEKTPEEKALEEKTLAQMDALAEAAGDRDKVPFDEAMDAINNAGDPDPAQETAAPRTRRRRVRTSE